MFRPLIPLALLAGLCAGCTHEESVTGGPADPTGAGTAGGDTPQEEPSGVDPAEALTALRAHIEELRARPEKSGVSECTVQHLLVSFRGAGTGESDVTKEEAEAEAAELWQRILAGADFDALVKAHTDDSYPGTYTMTLSSKSQPGKYYRGSMVPAFGNVGWRLDLEEIGVAGYDPATSKFGWHIIKRTR